VAGERAVAATSHEEIVRLITGELADGGRPDSAGHGMGRNGA
jgi:hypothetical protein